MAVPTRFVRVGPVLVIIEAVTFKIMHGPWEFICGSRRPGNGPDPWWSLQSHLLFNNIVTVWSFTVSPHRSQCALDSHPRAHSTLTHCGTLLHRKLIRRILPTNTHNRSLHLENKSSISHRNSPTPSPPFSQSLSLYPSLPQMAYMWFAYCL